MWPMVAVMAASTVYNAVSASQTGKANAKNAKIEAANNAQRTVDVAKSNIITRNATTQLNNSMVLERMGITNKMTQASADRNIILARTKTAYTNLLLDQEEIKLWDALELDLNQRDKIRAQDLGSHEARVGASGTTIGEGSNADVAVFINSQAGFDELVMRHNAHNTATDIINAKARNAWEGELMVQQILWDSRMSQTSELVNANLAIFGETQQAAIDTATMADQANMGSSAIIQNGASQAANYLNQGAHAANTAIVNGVSSMVSAYAAGYKGTSSEPVTLTGTPKISMAGRG